MSNQPHPLGALGIKWPVKVVPHWTEIPGSLYLHFSKPLNISFSEESNFQQAGSLEVRPEGSDTEDDLPTALQEARAVSPSLKRDLVPASLCLLKYVLCATHIDFFIFIWPIALLDS